MPSDPEAVPPPPPPPPPVILGNPKDGVVPRPVLGTEVDPKLGVHPVRLVEGDQAKGKSNGN